MQMIVDISLIIFMLLFSYAFGRKSESDNKPVVPQEVTWFTLFLLMGILLLLNLPSIIQMMASYGE